jgi:serine/threonine protein kinase
VRRSYEDEKGNPIETDYAFKKMHKPTLQRERNAVYKKGGEIEMITNLDKVYQEINIWATLFHPQIARLYEIIDDPTHDYIYLVMELCDCGQIAKWDDKSSQYVRNAKIEDDVIAYHLKGEKFENEINKIEAVAKILFRQLFIGLRHMHDDMLVIHRDIKLDNLLYSSKDHTLKITDFNVSYKLKDPKEVLYDQDGTIIYRRIDIIQLRNAQKPKRMVMLGSYLIYGHQEFAC